MKLCVALLAAAGFGMSQSWACALVSRSGEGVQVAQEEALIVWDSKTRTQHFIRRVSFDGRAKDFGFLVPTPSKPELADADNWTFRYLARLTEPKVITIPRAKGDGKAVQAASASASASGGGRVEVIGQASVAGFDAVILEASDAESLDRWLRQHGYVSSPDLMAWYRPYIERKWKITAFKIGGGGRSVSTSAVRMSFATDEPLFPYREPKRAEPDGRRLLRVYFLSEGRYDGVVGRDRNASLRPIWSRRIGGAERDQVFKLAGIPESAAGHIDWLSEVEDRATVRTPDDELYFFRTSDSELERQPIYRYESN